MSNHPPRRRWFRFSLWTLLVLVAVGCCWLGYYFNWADQRDRALDPWNPQWAGIVIGHSFGGTWAAPEVPIIAPNIAAPWPLGMLGRKGVEFIMIDGRKPEAQKSAAIARLKSLFPEAEIKEAPPQLLQIFDEAKSRRRAGGRL